MKITYDPEADALQIVFRTDRAWVDSLDIEEGVTADLDANGHIMGLEILDAKERIGADPLDCISIERLTEGACGSEEDALPTRTEG